MSGPNHIFRRINEGSRSRKIAESLIQRPMASLVRKISLLEELARVEGSLEVRCQPCGHVYRRSGAELVVEIGAETPLSRVRLSCRACGSAATMTLPVDLKAMERIEGMPAPEPMAAIAPSPLLATILSVGPDADEADVGDEEARDDKDHNMAQGEGGTEARDDAEGLATDGADVKARAGRKKPLDDKSVEGKSAKSKSGAGKAGRSEDSMSGQDVKARGAKTGGTRAGAAKTSAAKTSAAKTGDARTRSAKADTPKDDAVEVAGPARPRTRKRPAKD